MSGAGVKVFVDRGTDMDFEASTEEKRVFKEYPWITGLTGYFHSRDLPK
jgi:hypothetical protein